MPDLRKEEEHTLDLDDGNRAWIEEYPGGGSAYIAICSCGYRMKGRDGGAIAKMWVHHCDEAAKGAT